MYKSGQRSLIIHDVSSRTMSEIDNIIESALEAVVFKETGCPRCGEEGFVVMKTWDTWDGNLHLRVDQVRCPACNLMYREVEKIA